MPLLRLLKRTVFIADRATGKQEKFNIVVGVPQPQPGSDRGTPDRAKGTIDDAQSIFEQLVANGTIATTGKK